MDAEGNVIEEIPAGGSSGPLPTSEDRASRNEARLEARQAAVDEVRELLEDAEGKGPSSHGLS